MRNIIHDWCSVETGKSNLPTVFHLFEKVVFAVTEESERLEILHLSEIVLPLSLKQKQWCDQLCRNCGFVFAHVKSRCLHDAAHDHKSLPKTY